ncbi:MAG: DUF2892 domain-containing protein [Cyclobacteriaceae bacterium]|nr:DUF2892 domain-containing protein [Cyclobacteriaceae bacterium]
MRKNIFTSDRVFRLLIVITVVALYFKGILSGSQGILVLILGGVLLLTGFFRMMDESN